MEDHFVEVTEMAGIGSGGKPLVGQAFCLSRVHGASCPNLGAQNARQTRDR
ncbi:MAG: hypothetical protein Q8M07_10930 [Prosthecobacter sp.]|nr:hypothetical protein [Prosthecobacter sp.]